MSSATDARYTRWLNLAEGCRLRFKRPRGYRMEDRLASDRSLGFHDSESDATEPELWLEVHGEEEVGTSLEAALAWCRKRLEADPSSGDKVTSKRVELGDEPCGRFEAGSGGAKQVMYVKVQEGAVCCFSYRTAVRDARKKAFDTFARLVMETMQIKGRMPAPKQPAARAGADQGAVETKQESPAQEPSRPKKESKRAQPTATQSAVAPGTVSPAEAPATGQDKSARAANNGRVQLTDSGLVAKLPSGWQRQDDAENVIVYAPVVGFQPRIALFTQSSPKAPWRGTAGELQLLCQIYREMCSQIEVREAIRVQHGGSEGLRLDWSGTLVRSSQAVTGTVVVIPYDRHGVVVQYLAAAGESYREHEAALVGLLDSLRWQTQRGK